MLSETSGEADVFTSVEIKCTEEREIPQESPPLSPALGTSVFSIWGMLASLPNFGHCHSSTGHQPRQCPPMLSIRELVMTFHRSHFHHQKAFEGRAQKAFGCPCSVPMASGNCFIDASHCYGPAERAFGSTTDMSTSSGWKTLV